MRNKKSFGRLINVTGHNVWTILPRQIDTSPARPAHENNFAIRADNCNIRGERLDGVFCFNSRDGGINFFVAGAAAYRTKIRQAACLDNFVYINDSFCKP